MLGAGLSFAGGRGFGFAEAGYKYRGGGLRDAFVYTAQLGWNAATRATLLLNLRGEEPFSHEPGAGDLNSFVGVGDRVTYLVVGPSAIVKLGRGWAAQFDLEGSWNARNLAKGPMFRGGISTSASPNRIAFAHDERLPV